MNDSTIPVSASDAAAAGMRSVLDPRQADVRRVPTDTVLPSSLPPVQATVIDPDVTVAQLLNHASGPLPISVAVETMTLSADRHAFANLIVVNGLDWGRHDLTIESFKSVMMTDETDVFNLTVLEI